MSSLSIVVPTGIFPPDHGGPATYVPTIARELVRRGHHVSVVCLADDPGAPLPELPFEVHRIGRGLPKVRRTALTVAAILRAARGADVVYVNGLEIESSIAATIARTPTVHKIVGDPAWERAVNRGWFRGTIDDYQTSRKPGWLRLLDRMRAAPLRRARAVLVPSAYLRGIVAGWDVPESRIHVVRNAAAADDRAEPSDAATALPPFAGRTVVTISRLVAWKGLDSLIRVVSRAEAWRLVIVGDGPLRPALEAQAASSGAQDRIRLMGAVPHADALSYLSSADAFVLNSTYEGLPHAVLEAMAAGIPVVATRAGGTGEAVLDRETGLLVPPGDDVALENALREVLADPALASRLVAGARARLRGEFGFERMIDETERLLIEAAAN